MVSRYLEKKIAVLGYGIEGQSVENFFKKENIEISIRDKKISRRYLNDLSSFDIIFRSPGIYRYNAKLKEAEKKGVFVTSATKLFFELCPAKIIGVTGTKGKGTTATLIYKILKKSRHREVFLAGNLGKPMLDVLPYLTHGSIVVLELSSAQLIDLTVSPWMAVVLDITPDHLDYHQSLSEYYRAKKNILKFQKPNDLAVFNYDSPRIRKWAKQSKGHVYFFSCKQEIPIGSFVKDAKEIILKITKRKEILGKVAELKIIGSHNWLNICAACCAATLAGANSENIKETIFSFKGNSHRLEFVRKWQGIDFFNDSASTNPCSLAAAVKSFNKPVILIAGGSEKGLSFDDAGKAIAKSFVKTVILLGKTKRKIKRSILRAEFKGKIIDKTKTLKGCLGYALRASQKGDVILFSPGSASFDMFDNYQHRGEKFKSLVKQLA